LIPGVDFQRKTNCTLLDNLKGQKTEKNTAAFTTTVLLVITLSVTPAGGEESTLITTPPACPTCCEVLKPYPGISADELMKITYYLKYSKFARDYKSAGFAKLIPPHAPSRTKEWRRFRIILNQKEEEVDYKDLLIILGPHNMKGLSILTWTYLDSTKDQEVWMWLPSLRKVRRMSQSEEADPFLGSEFTTEDISTRRWESEIYKMVGGGKFKGYTAHSNNKMYQMDTDCYVIEAKPKRKDGYYSRRIIWLNKQSAAFIFADIYDPGGRKWKTHFKNYAVWENGCIPNTLWEGENQFTHHRTTIGFKENHIQFNTDLPETFFSQKTLMRSKW
jgi:hypothetical protein